VKRDIEIRWGLAEDEPRIAELLELNGMPRRAAFEECYIVAEEDGEVLAALSYRTVPKRLLLGLLVADPWAGERALAAALYAGAKDLAREMGVRGIRARSDGRADYPREAGYHRWVNGWRLDTAQLLESSTELPAGGWRRALALFGAPAMPFFRAFRTQDGSRRHTVE
jgi:acetyltransferase (GNAT) family protein